MSKVLNIVCVLKVIRGQSIAHKNNAKEKDFYERKRETLVQCGYAALIAVMCSSNKKSLEERERGLVCTVVSCCAYLVLTRGEKKSEIMQNVCSTFMRCAS